MKNSLIIILILTAPGSSAEAPVVSTMEQPPNEIIIYYTGPTDGYFEPCNCSGEAVGGLAARFWLCGIFKQNHPDAIFVDVGSLYDNEDVPHSRLKAPYIDRIYAEFGYDAVNLADGNLFAGEPYFDELRANTDIPFISYNIKEYENAPGYIDVKSGNYTVRIVGAIAGDSPMLNNAGYKIDKIKEVKKAKKEPGDYDVLVLLVNDCGASELRNFATDLHKDVDVIIGAGGVGYLPMGFTEIDGIAAVFSPNWSKYVGELRLTLDDKGNVESWSNRYYPVTRDTPEEPTVATIINEYNAELQELLSNTNLLSLPTTPHPLGDEFAGTDVCASCHTVQYEQWKGTDHAVAYQSLIDENVERNPECVSCHVTGYSYVGGFNPAEPELYGVDVGCEECHEPSKAHTTNPTMSTIAKPNIETCTKCHNDKASPDFVYSKYRDRVVH